MVTSGLQVPVCLSPAHLITQERSWQNHEVGELFQGVEAGIPAPFLPMSLEFTEAK